MILSRPFSVVLTSHQRPSVACGPSRHLQASLTHPKQFGHGWFAKIVQSFFNLILFHPYGSQRANFKVKFPQSLISVFTPQVFTFQGFHFKV